MTPTKGSRRTFIKQAAGVVAAAAAVTGAAAMIVPRHVLGGIGYTPPSDQLNLAVVGAGGKGASDIRNASVNGRERVVWSCLDLQP